MSESESVADSASEAVAAAPALEAPEATAGVSPPALELPQAAMAALQTEPAGRVPSASRPSFPPPLPSSPSLPPPLPAAVSFPPPPPSAPPDTQTFGQRLEAVNKRFVEVIPPRWLEVARQYPVLWMAVAPVTVALLFILVVVALQPTPQPQVSSAAPPPSAVAALASVDAPRAAPAAQLEEPVKKPSAAGLEGKSPDQLSVDELLLLNDSHAQQKRDDATALSRKLHDQADLISDQAVQAQLFRFAADPDTAAAALAAMAQARAPIGPDLLYEVWSNRALPATTTELARSLLFSRDVRPGASPALVVAMELRGGTACQAVDAALSKASSDGDRRSMFLLTRLNSRRGCGPDKADDCYACLRAHNKLIISSVDAVKKRNPPSYPSR